MTLWWRCALMGSVGIVAFDALAYTIAQASGSGGITYGSYLILVASGYYGRRAGLGYRSTWLLGAWVGFIDATIGWEVASWLGARRVELTWEESIRLAVYVSVLASFLSAVGAMIYEARRADSGSTST